MSESQIPQSDALAEAQADSLAELLSRDPEDPKMDRGRLVQALRAQRERWLRVEQEKRDAPKRSKATKTVRQILQAPANVNPDDMGL